jgi:succinoglycan biosynthesis protein ExoL
MKISYFVHDIGHPDLVRRFEMLRQGGADSRIFGFRRARPVDNNLAGSVVDLGRTIDGQFAQRTWTVAKTIPRLRQWANELALSDVVLARNLEMLVLAATARSLYAPRSPLVYECLDVHRLMLSNHLVGAGLRQVERMLLASSQGLMVSSPAFIREYFERNASVLPKTLLVENKVFPDPRLDQETPPLAPGPPWRIGWFGVLRCRRSLEMLSRLVRSLPGTIEVVVAGLPASNVFPDANKSFGGIPGLVFHGPFKDEAELSRLFRSVHFAWAIDYYEAGGNSSWLLPNRLYRAALYQSVPLALANVETGRWLADHGTGVLLGEPVDEQLIATMRDMTPRSFSSARAAVARIPRSSLITEAQECRDLVATLGELRLLVDGPDSRKSRSRAEAANANPRSPRT